MELSRALFLGLVGAVAVARLAELSVSRRRARQLTVRGMRAEADPVFPWMVLVHTGVLAGAVIEVVWLRRTLIPVLAIPALTLVLLATALRLWVIRTLGFHWNVRIIRSARLGVVATGPYRWVRHPNYLAVLIELGALPLVHGAFLTAIAGSLAHAWVLRRRIASEEAVLLDDPMYREIMGHKPKLVPSPLSLFR